MASITAQLEFYRSSLDEATAGGDEAVARKLAEQIRQLEDFHVRHPEESEAPSPFEIFCDLNPSDIHCRVYDD